MADAVPTELRARMAGAAAASATPAELAAAARARLHAVLDLVEQRKGVRTAGGLNVASTELLVADALLTDAAARAAADGTLSEVLAALDVESLSARARAIDEGAA